MQKTTKGEMIYGTRRNAILMYPFEITCKAEFEEVLYHELGHLLTYTDNHDLYETLKAVTSIEDEHGEACFGSKLWFEFVAQAISNFVADREPSIYTGKKQYELLGELQMAFISSASAVDCPRIITVWSAADADVFSALGINRKKQPDDIRQTRKLKI